MTSQKPRNISTHKAAVQILYRVDVDNSYSDVLLKKVIKESQSINPHFLEQLVKGTLKWRGRIDWILSPYLKKGVYSIDAWTRNALRVGVYGIMFIEKVPFQVSVNESVQIAKELGRREAHKLVNAVLRRIVENKRTDPMTDIVPETIEEISSYYSHPKWLVERWIKEFGERNTLKLLDFNNSNSPLYVRLNPLKGTLKNLIEYLKTDNIHFTPTRYSCDSLQILKTLLELQKLKAYSEGLFLVQDLSATLVSPLLSPEPDEIVLDMCAAPGGKTTHLSSIMNNTGKIFALDQNNKRLSLIRENCNRLGVRNVEVIDGDGRYLKFPFQFDKILVDAPCSGLGILSKKPEARWNKFSEDIDNLLTIQISLLENASKLLKEGGKLLYSTCTLSNLENEGVVKEFLRTHPNFKLISLHEVLPPELVTHEGYYKSFPPVTNMAGAFGALFMKLSN